MKSRFCTSVLLIVLGLILVASNGSAAGQTTTSVTTVTSLATYTIATNTVSTVISSTMSGGGFTAYSWWTSCAFWATSFSAQPGDEAFATLQTASMVDFYLMSQPQLDRVRATICNSVAAPVWPSILHYTVTASQSVNWSPNSGGLYYFVVVNLNSATVPATFTGYVRSNGTATLLSYGTLTSEIVQGQTLTQNFGTKARITEEQQTTVSSPTSSIPFVSIIEIIVVIVIIAALLGLLVRRRPQREETKVY